jgi:hypothetical protein
MKKAPSASGSFLTPSSSNNKGRRSRNARITRIMRSWSVALKNSAGNTRVMSQAVDQDSLQLMDESNEPWVKAWEREFKLRENEVLTS